MDPDALSSRLPPPSCNICHDFQPIQSNPNAGWMDKWLNRYNIEIESLKQDCYRCTLLNAVYDRLELSLVADYPDVDSTNSGPGSNKGIWLTPGTDGLVVARYSWTRKSKTDPDDQRGDPFFYRQVNIRLSDSFNGPKVADQNKLSSLHWSSKSHEGIQFVKDELQACTSGKDGHDCCLHPQKDEKLPKRVIQINFEDETICLHETHNSERGVYVALSHCWGPPGLHPIRTNMQTLPQFKNSISWSELTAVFQDAVWLCKELGIQYLWIDSLCIIQDDTQDWDIESSKMAQYYSNAYLTVAVGASSDGNTPFLREADERWHPMSYLTADQNGSPTTYIVQEHFSDEAFLYQSSNYFKQGRGLLLNRAWCLQETVLSNRVVHFTPSDIIWECSGTTRCLDTYHRLDAANWNVRNTLYDLEHWSSSDEERQLAVHKVWNALVTKYTLRALSFQRDKLPAFSGVASYFAKFFAGKYLAGIWESQLPVGLCWKVVDLARVENPLALKEFLAPSWSWASLPATIGVEGPQSPEYQKLIPSYRPKILEAECASSSEKAPFGRLDSGHILIDAPLFEVRITCVKPSPKNPDWIKYKVAFGAEVKIPEEADFSFRQDTLLAVQNGQAFRAMERDQFDYVEDTVTFQGVAWVLWITGDKDQCMEGLVLGQSEISGEFQRLGHLLVTGLQHDTFPSEHARSTIKVV